MCGGQMYRLERVPKLMSTLFIRTRSAMVLPLMRTWSTLEVMPSSLWTILWSRSTREWYWYTSVAALFEGLVGTLRDVLMQMFALFDKRTRQATSAALYEGHCAVWMAYWSSCQHVWRHWQGTSRQPCCIIWIEWSKFLLKKEGKDLWSAFARRNRQRLQHHWHPSRMHFSRRRSEIPAFQDVSCASVDQKWCLWGLRIQWSDAAGKLSTEKERWDGGEA